MKNIEEILWEDWQIESILGKGSYGTVYKASKQGFNSKIYTAIKHLSIPQDNSEVSAIRSEGMSKAEITEYFADIVKHISDEIRLMDSLKGTANIVNIEDFKIIQGDDGISWDILIRMEILEDLNKYFSNRSGSISDIVSVGIDICNALECCERANVIHRDIKPENIFVNKFGNFKLGDFGIAREYSQNRGDMSMRGTPYYIAPEIFEGRDYDLTVDIYSLGVVLYRMLNKNRLPFFPTEGTVSFQQRNDALKMRISGEVFNPPVNSIPELSEVLYKACAYNPYDRYQNATDFRNDLIRVKNILDSMENPPVYEFIQEEVSPNEIQYESLGGGTVLLEENAVKSADTEKSDLKSKLNAKTIIICVAALVLVAALVFGGSKLLSKNKDDDTPKVDAPYSDNDEEQPEDNEEFEPYDVPVPDVDPEDEVTEEVTEESTTAPTTKAGNNQPKPVTTKKKVTTTKKKVTTTKKKAESGNNDKEPATKKKETTTKETTTKETTTKSTPKPSFKSFVATSGGRGIYVSWSTTDATSVEISVTDKASGTVVARFTETANSSKTIPLEAGTYKVKIVAFGKGGTTKKSKDVTHS